MCARPVSQAPASAYPSQQTPAIQPNTKTYKNQQAYMAAQEKDDDSRKLALVHQNNLDREATTPDAGHTRVERDGNLRKQALLRELQSIEKKIENLQKEARRHEKDKASLLSSDTANQLTACRRRHKEIQNALESATTQSKSLDGDGSGSTYDTVSTTSTSSDDGSNSSERSSSSSASKRGSDEKSATSRPSKTRRADPTEKFAPVQDTAAASSSSSTLDALSSATELLRKMERTRHDLAQEPQRLDISSSDYEVNRKKELDDLDKDIRALRELIEAYLATTSPVSGDSAKTAPTRTLTSLVRTKTNQRSRPAEILGQKAQRQTTVHTVDDKADLASLHDAGNRLSLRMPEDLRQRFSPKDKEKIAALEYEMEQLAAEGDDAFQNYVRVQKTIERERQSGNGTPKNMEALEKRLHRYQAEYLACSKKLLPLIEQWDAIVEHNSTAPAKSAKQRAEERKALIDSYKSEETRDLEETHAKLLQELQQQVENNSAYDLAWDALAGVAGFSVSFLVGNTLGRFIPGGPWVGAAVSASLHVIAATPVVKGLMARVWSANSLAELNNHFKLVGNRWGDQWRGETGVKKYSSRDPNQTNKLTIDERLTEEKGLGELVANRYRDEEAAYWAYSVNYSIKASMCAYMATWMSQTVAEVRGTEAAWHAVMGMISGAEYVSLQQHARSQRAGATMSAVPTREIFAAQEASLRALHSDLTDAIENARHPDSPVDDASLRVLMKECSRIAHEISVAEQKSQLAGITRYEFLAQFQGDAIWDTLSEVVGRFITLIPVSLVSQYTNEWRKSSDPALMFLGHFLPAVALMMPVPLPVGTGFTGRPWVCGLIRAGIQAFISGRATPTVVTKVPASVHPVAEEKARAEAGSDDDTREDVSDDSPESSNDRVSTASSDSTTDTDSGGRKTRADDQGKRDSLSADDIIVDVSDSDSDSGDEDSWQGNPTARDLNAAN